MEREKERDSGRGRLTEGQKEDLKEMEEAFEKVKVLIEKWLKPRDINRIIGDKE